MGIRTIDLLIICMYLLGMLILGMRLGRGNHTSKDYFLANRSMSFFPVGLSVIATMVSAASFIGGPGGSYQDGLQYYMINSNLPLVFFIAYVFFLPFLYNLNVTSCYEYLNKRFGESTRLLCSLGFLATSVILVGTMIYGPTMILEALTGWDMKIVLPLLLFVVIIYTLVGGIKAVILSDAIQMVILWVGVFVCFCLALANTGMSFSDTIATAIEAGKLQTLDFSFDLNVNNGVWVSTIGVGILHLQYFTCDQSQVQRLFTSKDIKNMKKSFLLSGIIVNIQFAVFMVIGLFLFVGNEGIVFEDTNQIMIQFILDNIPVGIFGVITAAILAATMSSIDSLLNSMAAVFIHDIYMPRCCGKDEQEVDLKASKKITCVFAVIICIFTYFGLNGNTMSLVTMMGVYCSYITGSIMGVFVLGIFTEKATNLGASIGFVGGIIATLFASNTEINWGWYNVVGVVTCIALGYVVSLCKYEKREDLQQISELTYRGVRKKMMAEGNVKENGYYKVPGGVDKVAYVFLVSFIVQYVVLFWLGGL